MNVFLKTSLYLVSGIIAGIAILVGIYWSTFSRLQRLYFPFEIPKSFNLNQCRYLDKSVYGCEDIEIIGDYAVIACASQKGRAAWWPPLFRFDNTSTESDAVYAYDFIEKRLEKLKLLRHPTNHLSLHGISAFPGAKENKIVIGIINHRKQGSCVELYDHRIGTDEMIFKELICDPLIQYPNSISLTSRTSFYLTNTFLHYATRWDVAAALVRGKGTGNLVYRSEQGTVEEVKPNLITPNGVAVMGSFVYVVLTAVGQVMVMERNTHGGRLRFVATIQLPSMADNVHVVKETGQLVLTGILHARQLYTWAQPDTKKYTKIPSAIFTVQNNTRKDSQFYGDRYVISSVILDPDSKLLSLPSTAAVHWPSKKMLVGGPLMKGLVECDWPSSIKEFKR